MDSGFTGFVQPGRSQNRLKNLPEISRKYHVITTCSYLLNNHGCIFIFSRRAAGWHMMRGDMSFTKSYTRQSPLTFNNKKTYKFLSLKENHSSGTICYFQLRSQGHWSPGVVLDGNNTFMNLLTILEPSVTVVRTCTSTASVTDSLANSLFECLGFRGASEAFTQ